MIKEALEYIVGMRRPDIVDHCGITYTDKSMIPLFDPPFQTLELSSLQGFINYALSGLNSEGELPLGEEKYFIHVASSESVYLFTCLRKSGKRDLLAHATHKHSTKFSFGTWLEPEDFIVQLKSNALGNENKLQVLPEGATAGITSDYFKLLTLASSISTERIATMKDSGVAQQVATRQGVTFEMTEIPQFLTLEFRRTFPDILPVESKFFLRVRDNLGKPQMALFECTRDAWEMQTRAKIKEWITEKIAPVGFEPIVPKFIVME